jgi:hypothetical protein
MHNLVLQPTPQTATPQESRNTRRITDSKAQNQPEYAESSAAAAASFGSGSTDRLAASHFSEKQSSGCGGTPN